MDTGKTAISEELREILKDLPTRSGVYLMKDARGEVIYVGKAKVLTNRVRSYFSGEKDIKTTLLVRKIVTLETIVTENEYEALLLENNLIKKYNPRFNISLKDGKTYPMIRITNEAYPRVFKTRRMVEDGSEYFGPFPNFQHLDLYLELVAKLFPLRKCKGPLPKRELPCLYHHIGKCAAPCVGKISQEDYQLQIRRVRNLLQGRTATLEKDLQSQMKESATQLKFERAAELRDTLKALKELQEKSRVVDFSPEQRDYVALASEGHLATFCVLQMRGGKLQGRELFPMEYYGTEDEVFLDFLFQYYGRNPHPRDEIYLSMSLELDLVAPFFQSKEGKGPQVCHPQGGRHYTLLRMALENAHMNLKKRLEGGGNHYALSELQKILGLDRLPHRIEGFDIAQLDGTNPTASLISFWNGVPDPKNYRKFHIKSLDGAIDDYQAIKEVVARRYTRLVNEGKDLPDLIMVDGGKGQVSSAQTILTALGVKVPLCGLAKKNEEIWLPGQPKPLLLPPGHPALRILQAIRDETHRFATAFNQKLRHKRIRLTTLDGVPGMGEKRSAKLLKAYGSLEKIGEAQPEEVAEKGGISLQLASTVQAYLKDRRVRDDSVKDVKRFRRT